MLAFTSYNARMNLGAVLHATGHRATGFGPAGLGVGMYQLHVHASLCWLQPAPGVCSLMWCMPLQQHVPSACQAVGLLRASQAGLGLPYLVPMQLDMGIGCCWVCLAALPGKRPHC